MHVVQFVGAVLLLLLTPGPTNTLMMLAGYLGGWRSSTRLIAAEVAGYLVVILPITLLAAPLVAAFPDAFRWMKVIAVAWVLFLSWRLWRSSAASGNARQEVAAWRVFATTVLNPKAPIIAIAVMPQLSLPDVIPWIAGFSGLVVLAANMWLAAGAFVARGSGRLLAPRTVQKLAASGLLCFAAILAGSSVHAMN